MEDWRACPAIPSSDTKSDGSHMNAVTELRSRSAVLSVDEGYRDEDAANQA
jgi:hypothetical protein